jgi:riboflavin kinase / FMN adenylyltransferase
MDIITDLSAIADHHHGNILAIGNFDGVHKGHQAVLNRVRELAKAKGVKTAVLTFEPHPRKLFRPDDPPFRITPAAIKHRRLKAEGVDTVFSLPFDWDFASQSAEDFIKDILVNGIKPSAAVIGKDFRFGQLRKGTPDMIEDAGIPVDLMEDIGHDGIKYSSTAIRQALRDGQIDEANATLGWEWEIEGEITRGDRRGHELGYPTANVLLGDTLHPAYGVYATKVQIEGEDAWRKAATNIGIRPMFELRVGQVEAHILDFEDRDIYGRKLRIRPIRRLRGEAKFSGLDALVAQIEEDCRQTRILLK